MTQNKKPIKTSTGPITAAGKSRSAMNAISHGARSAKLLLPGESSEDYDALLRDLALDLRPVGIIEQMLVEKIAGALWRKRRLESAETDVIASAQMRAVSSDELTTALGLTVDMLPPHMVERNGFRYSKIELLPEWMLDPSNAPSKGEGLEAVALVDEWSRFTGENVEVETEQEARRDFPLHWARFEAEMHSDGYEDVQSYIEEVVGVIDFPSGFTNFMDQHPRVYYWVAYWHCNRDKMAAAFPAIAVKKALAEWDLDRSHRYHIMLDNQLFKLLREYRETHAWRLSNLDMADDECNQPPNR